MSSTDPSAPPGWLVVVDKAAQKQLDRLPPRDFARVDAALLSMAADPFAGDLERLTRNEPQGRSVCEKIDSRQICPLILFGIFKLKRRFRDCFTNS